MTLAITLFVLRILSALTLLAILSVMFWTIWQDYRKAATEAESSRKIYGYLIGLTANGEDYEPSGEVYPLLALTTIGRSPTNTIRIDNAFASSEHATLSLRNGVWWLEDNQSRNGTLLNEMAIQQPVIITHNDIMSISTQHFRIELDT